jgi:metal-sulfur cluster biosynthetic enzyme
MKVYKVNTSEDSINDVKQKFHSENCASYNVLANSAEEAIKKTQKTFSNTDELIEYINEVIFITEIDII